MVKEMLRQIFELGSAYLRVVESPKQRRQRRLSRFRRFWTVPRRSFRLEANVCGFSTPSQRSWKRLPRGGSRLIKEESGWSISPRSYAPRSTSPKRISTPCVRLAARRRPILKGTEGIRNETSPPIAHLPGLLLCPAPSLLSLDR